MITKFTLVLTEIGNCSASVLFKLFENKISTMLSHEQIKMWYPEDTYVDPVCTLIIFTLSKTFSQEKQQLNVIRLWSFSFINYRISAFGIHFKSCNTLLVAGIVSWARHQQLIHLNLSIWKLERTILVDLIYQGALLRNLESWSWLQWCLDG